MEKKKIIIINGPNLNLLGKRQPEIYGTRTFEDYFEELQKQFVESADLLYFQSNYEGALIDKIQEVGFQNIGIVLNAGGYTHTSVAIADCVSAVPSPVIEVHISNIKEREYFRRYSYLEDVCQDSIMGKGLPGYQMAIEKLLSLMNDG